MRILALSLLFVLAACASDAASVRATKSLSGPQFAKDREACMTQAQFNASGNNITFGGGFGGNAFFSSGPYLDCMVARGYAPDAIGDPLGTPATERSIGGY